MNFFSYYISCLLLMIGFLNWNGCEPQPVEPPYEPINQPLDIDLGKLDNNYLSLKEYARDTVYIGGQYVGDRLVFKEVSNLVLVFVNCSIESTHAEDALVFAERIDGLDMWAKELRITGGGITFWNVVQNAQLRGGSISNTHTGIRATQDLAHQNILITEWDINNASHEGIYLGVSEDTPRDGSGFFVTNNTISNCGWDGIQIGNCRYTVVSGNTITNCGASSEYGQDYGITINPGSLAYIYDNTILETAKPIQVLESRVFFHAPESR